MLARLKGAVAENWRWVLQIQHVLRSGLALRIKLFESTGELIQLPLSSECGCFVPSWFLAPKARQRNLSVHGGEGSEKPQAFCHRGKAPSQQGGGRCLGLDCMATIGGYWSRLIRRRGRARF
jgi:hypothetical protein